MLRAGDSNIFDGHLLQQKNLHPVLRVSQEEVWPSVFLLACFALLVFVKVRAYPRLVKLIQSTYNAQTLQQLDREESNRFKYYGMALTVFFTLNLSFLIYKINQTSQFVLNEAGHFSQYLFFTLLLLLLYALKYTANLMLAFFTGEERLIRDYQGASARVNQASGMFLFPWIVLVEFGRFYPLFFISGALITLVAATLVKWYRGIIASMVEERVALLQIFSYFCGLEILPVIVLVKYVIETF